MTIRCEGVEAALVTGGAVRRWVARRHAARCPRCARALADVGQIARVLSEAPPLSTNQRGLWLAAAGEADTRPAPGRRSLPALGVVAFALVVVSVGLWWALRPVKVRHAPPVVADVEPVTVRPESLQGVEKLRGGVAALASDLDDLRRRVELLDSRMRIEALMARLGPPPAAREL